MAPLKGLIAVLLVLISNNSIAQTLPRNPDYIATPAQPFVPNERRGKGGYAIDVTNSALFTTGGGKPGTIVLTDDPASNIAIILPPGRKLRPNFRCFFSPAPRQFKLNLSLVIPGRPSPPLSPILLSPGAKSFDLMGWGPSDGSSETILVMKPDRADSFLFYGCEIRLLSR